MEILSYNNKDIFILSLNGKFNANTAPEVQKKIFDFINEGAIKIILNFKNVSYLSREGFRVLYAVLDLLQKKNGILFISEPVIEIRRVFEMVELDSDIQIFSNSDEAVKKIQFDFLDV